MSTSSPPSTGARPEWVCWAGSPGTVSRSSAAGAVSPTGFATEAAIGLVLDIEASGPPAWALNAPNSSAAVADSFARFIRFPLVIASTATQRQGKVSRGGGRRKLSERTGCACPLNIANAYGVPYVPGRPLTVLAVVIVGADGQPINADLLISRDGVATLELAANEALAPVCT